MYAIVQTGGKQYKVQKDMLVKVEKLNAEVGAKVELPAVLVSDEAGKVSLGKDAEKIKVLAEVVKHDKGAKILVLKYKPKKNVRRRQGHRQPYTQLRITSIG
jgi:large subunit ribosomal protein L21